MQSCVTAGTEWPPPAAALISAAAAAADRSEPGSGGLNAGIFRAFKFKCLAAGSLCHRARMDAAW